MHPEMQGKALLVSGHHGWLSVEGCAGDFPFKTDISQLPLTPLRYRLLTPGLPLYHRETPVSYLTGVSISSPSILAVYPCVTVAIQG